MLREQCLGPLQMLLRVEGPACLRGTALSELPLRDAAIAQPNQIAFEDSLKSHPQKHY